MKVLGICGSHRKESNSLFLLKKALDVCEKEGLETGVIELYNKEVKPCTVCNLCASKFECSQKDVMQEIYEKMIEADAIILASPAYYAMVSGKLKNFMDRTLPLRRNGMKLAGKLCGAISVGASRNGGQEFVCGQILRWSGLQEMMAVTDKGTSHFGGIGWVARDTKPEDDEIGIETCENLGTKIVETLKLLGRKS